MPRSFSSIVPHWVGQILSDDKTAVRRCQVARSTRSHAARSKSVKITLTPAQHGHLKALALEHGQPMAVHLRESALAYSHQKYLVPENFLTEFRAYRFLLRNACNNLNQMAYKANSSGKFTVIDEWKLKNTVAQMEKDLEYFLANPPLLNASQIHVAENP